MSISATPDSKPANGGEQLPSAFLAGIAEHFVLEREIGRGGMAIVWRAHRVGDDRPVALKILRPLLAEAIASQRFLREIRIASAVSSPALIPLEESGEIANLPYYVMPLAEGGSLRQRLKEQGQLHLNDAARIARTVATGLAALHQQGFVHRDIKPENVLITASGEIVLADYSIAHAVTAAAKDDLTSTGIVIGTPQYMSPEQASAMRVDKRSDIYSLGCLLYEMLTGEAPFQGSPQTILARHMHEPPPSLRVVRGTIPVPLEAVVMRMLAKVPADRFDTAESFIAALDALGEIHASTTNWIVADGSRRRRLAMAAGLAVPLAAVLVYWLAFRPPQLDPDRVIVFPFATVGGAGGAGSAQVPMLVGSALEHTATTRWLDGFALLDEPERQLAAGLNAGRARALARRERARYYVDGAISRRGETLSVQVRLHDAGNGLLVDSKTESGANRTAGDLALRAVVRVLPKLTGLDQLIDVSGLTGHNPSAVDDWLRGERAYRQSRMAPALELLERAVVTDSSLAPAAFRAAEAASYTNSYTNKPERPLAYVKLALRHAEALSPRQRRLAVALERFLEGRADEALERLRPALAPETETADAWMLAGEIQLHLLPSVAVDSLARKVIPPPTTWPSESFAEAAFERARVLDPGFSPPLEHLAEIAARRGDLPRLDQLSRTLTRANTDSVLAMRMTLMERCLRDGPENTDWAAAYKRNWATLYHVGFYLRAGSGPRSRPCALAAFRAALSANAAQGPEDWGSLMILHGMLVAQNQNAAALQLVDSAVAGGLPSALALYVLDAAGGIDVGQRADAFLTQLASDIDKRGTPSLWLLAMQGARARDTARLARIEAVLEKRTRSSGSRLDSLMFGVAHAYGRLASADTANALAAFAVLRPTAELHVLEGSLWEALAPERLTYAEVLLARGQAAEAHRIASTFDHPSIVIHELFLRQSLDLRERAARKLGDQALERSARTRMAALQAAGR